MPKIIVLYILKQVSKTIFVTFLILFGILFLNESIQFLEKASRGELYPELLVLVLLFSFPSLLEVAIPISVFLGVLISIYNLNKTNEISFAYQVGLGLKGLIFISVIPAIFLSIFVAFNSFYLVPLSNSNLSFLSDTQKFSDTFKLMGEGKINKIPDLNGVFYADKASDRGFQDVFANFNSNDGDLVINASEVLGRSAEEDMNKLIFEDGNMLVPSDQGYMDLGFKELSFLFPKKIKPIEKKLESMTLSSLIANEKDLLQTGEILKRLSMALMLIVSVLLAVPLSLRMANNGRFALILIGLVIFLSYYGLAIGQKAFVSEAIFTPTQIFLLVHSIYLSMAFLFFSLERTAIDLGSVITTKFSKNRILQLFVLIILVCLLFNFIYLGGVK
jgi:lipopolysaccharide export system permease protein|tara:strand:+ start:2260 stop:3426 length:1167 start_codon:yes stop_codon:yes gene_type:complete